MDTIDDNVLNLIYSFIYHGGRMPMHLRLVSQAWNRYYLLMLGELETVTFSEKVLIGSDSDASIEGLEDQILEYVNRYRNVIRLSIYGFKTELHRFFDKILARSRLRKSVEALYIFTVASPNHPRTEAIELNNIFPNLRTVWLWNNRHKRLLKANNVEWMQIPKQIRKGYEKGLYDFCEWYEMTGEVVWFWQRIVNTLSSDWSHYQQRCCLKGIKVNPNKKFKLPIAYEGRTTYAYDYLDNLIFDIILKNKMYLKYNCKTVLVDIFTSLVEQGYNRRAHCLQLAKYLDRLVFRANGSRNKRFEKGMKSVLA
jgi:hypothetical protein